MVKKLDKEALFDNYFSTCVEVFPKFESIMCIDGICNQFFGTECENLDKYENPKTYESAKYRVRNSEAWSILSWLYDYAVDGIIPEGQEPEDIVISGSEVLSFVRTENEAPSPEWEKIVAQGDGRFALDNSQDLLLEKLQLLASVDVRTIRNAISAGELMSRKVDGHIFIDNDSARNWLSGRRGFKPTRIITHNTKQLHSITSPAEFASFLITQRQKIGLDFGDKKLVVFHPGVDIRSLSDIENGVFKLPLDTVFPLADLYQLNRNEFLSTIMRVFFKDQLNVLNDIFNERA